MSQSSDFETAVSVAKAYEAIGKSGASYVFFFFPDNSICAAKKVPTHNRAGARLDFSITTKAAIQDCATGLQGTTYQQGRKLLKQLEA